jgi:opacity protein-like surface antigen
MRAVLVLVLLAPLCLAGTGDRAEAVRGYVEKIAHGGTAARIAPAPERERWLYGVDLYLWAAGMKGDLSARGLSIPVDIGFDDIVKDLDFAFMLHATARRGRWGMYLDAAYIALKAERTGMLGQAQSLKTTLFFGELAVTCRLWERAPPGKARWTLGAYAGARVYSADAEISLAAGSGSQGAAWVDPIVGLDARVAIAKWGFGARADIGGFGLGSESAWSVLVGARYRFTKLFALAAGYRWLDFDYRERSGADAFEFDVQMAGPFLALVVTF